ncbi:calcium-binding protein [Pseudanabaena galeata UHCC 0370]|uniref:Calcium-binding protein n=1 Tax=Pseudanabaena galeata UHCC 0370 TaxID=3110310 RepID=A0ABU5TEU5_9CYAN|nr:calcium-binding protein [Pseudanabaena galeata]MEA5476765.1 calcium-binding protein [Pseudanabaena galeata UHCC 0370]
MTSIYRTFGAGNDTIQLANPGADALFIDGGAGDDRLILNFGLGDVGTGMTFGATTFGTGVARRSTLGTNSTSLDYTSFTNVENFSVSGTSKDDNIVVSYGNNEIRTGAGNDRVTVNAGSYGANSNRGFVDGGLGFDFLTVDLSSQTNNLNFPSLQNMRSIGVFAATNFEQFDIKTGSGNDTVIQSAIINGVVLRANDVIRTGAGNDIINAGLGDDTVYGGDGIDRLIADFSIGDTGSGLTFNGGTQFGSAFRNVSSTSSTRLDSIFFDRVEEFTVTGTSKNDTITTYGGNDIINGGAGNDTIRTGAGNDVINGDAGNDILDGGVGNDKLTGGTGNDTYIVDSIGDNVFETSTLITEIDTVEASITYTLGVNLENLTLTGSGAIDGTGNSLNNILIGNSRNNTLNGGAGNDTLIGGGGSDILVGGAGNDVLTGGLSNDLFLYNTNAAFSSGSVGIDRITDFIKIADKIVLDKTTFTALQSLAATGFSIASEFAVVSSDAAAQASAAKIVYNQGTGSLFYNQNGASAGFGTGAQFATLTSNPLLAASDFIIQA